MLSSNTLKDAVNERDDVEWLRSQKDLAVRLAPYGIRPRQMRGGDGGGGRALRGDFRADFEETWERHVVVLAPHTPGIIRRNRYSPGQLPAM